MIQLLRIFLASIILLWNYEVRGVSWCPDSCSPSYAATHPTNVQGKCEGTDEACPWPDGYCGLENTSYNSEDNDACSWYCCPANK